VVPVVGGLVFAIAELSTALLVVTGRPVDTVVRDLQVGFFFR
jgi:hypothetical protein